MILGGLVVRKIKNDNKEISFHHKNKKMASNVMLSPIVESDTTESEMESSSESDSDTFSDGDTVPMVDSDSDADDDHVNIQLDSLNWQSVAAADGIVNSGITFAPNHPVGPKFCIRQDSKPHELSLLGQSFLDELVYETNIYGDAKAAAKGDDLPRTSQLRSWKHTNKEELLAFFGLVINMGLVKVSSIHEYWNTRNESQSVPYFRKVFSYNRFNMLQTTFHFPEGDDQNAKMKKVEYIVKHFASRFQRFYYMKQNVSIDESLIGFQGRAPGIQYLPDKHHHRFGFNIYYVKVIPDILGTSRCIQVHQRKMVDMDIHTMFA